MAKSDFRTTRASNAYRFLLQSEQTGQCFTVDDLAKVSGYKPGTIDSYLGKKWRRFVVKSPDNPSLYTVRGFVGYSFQSFYNDLRQTIVRSDAEKEDVVRLNTAQLLELALFLLLWLAIVIFLRKHGWWIV